MSEKPVSESGLAAFFDTLEETFIALLLGAMTIITFINVVLRYGFQTGLTWGLEATSFLFAWLVLFGVSYAVKINAHLGVDVLVNAFSPPIRKVFGVIAGLLCMVYALLLLKGAWDYWANFANLPQTTGRWFPTGFEEMKRTSFRGWYEVLEVPMPDLLRWIEPIFNEGERYDKLPRLIPYFILPVGAALLLFRFAQATVSIWKGTRHSMIASHEVEDLLDGSADLERKD